jgi:predicted ATPase/DNA-binding CsgD family transcriptional regulator
VSEVQPASGTPGANAAPRLQVPLTSFIGRRKETDQLRRLLVDGRLVTLSGAGGLGKTRLALRVAAQLAGAFADGVWQVDFAPIADPDLVPATVAHALGLSDQPGRSPVDTLLDHIADLNALLLLDNCEHLLDASASLVNVLLSAGPGVKVLATSREPIGVDGEVTFRVPSLSVEDEAVELFANRARLVRSTFDLTDANRAAVTEICSRLDGMPLAIELAAARVRALSPDEILDGLRDRFRLLTGGARTAVPRQQTLRASVDWSHELLTQPERVLFRRLAVFSGGFDLAAAEVAAAGDGLERELILDTLTLLVDKSLVLAEADDSGARTRYRLLETIRQYAFERLAEAGEAEAVRTRHRDFYAGVAAAVGALGRTGLEQSLARAAVEIDNFRAAFAWSREHSDTEAALMLASALQPLWLASGRPHEGLAWFDAVLSDDGSADVAPAVWAGALADRALLDSWAVSTETTEQAELALGAARESGDQRLLVRALIARGFVGYLHGEPAEHYFAEAAELARALGDSWRLGQVLGQQANVAFLAGDPNAANFVAAEGRELADAIGDQFTSRQCRTWAAWAQMIVGDLREAATHLSAVRDESQAGHDPMWWVVSAHYGAKVAAYQGDSNLAAARLADTAPDAEKFGAMWSGNSHGVRAVAALASGDIPAADQMSRTAWELLADVGIHQRMYGYVLGEVALARGELVTAHRWADEAVSSTIGWHRVLSLTTRARVQVADREPELAEQDAYDALALAADLGAHLGIPDILECLAATAGTGGSHARSGRLFGAAAGIRQRMGAVRFKVHDAEHAASLRATRDALGDEDFDAAFAEGSTLSTLEAITYAQRGKGERRRPTMGWSSLTPAERDVVRLVCDGLANKEIAKRLLVSPRTVQTHLTHIYTKLNLTSRVQLVQEASRHQD